MGGDVLDVETGEDGSKHAVLRNPNYIYRINPKNFTPVVTLNTRNNDGPTFLFSHEWISDQEVNLSDPEQLIGEVEEVRDVTELLENYHILSDTKQYKER